MLNRQNQANATRTAEALVQANESLFEILNAYAAATDENEKWELRKELKRAQQAATNMASAVEQVLANN